MKFQNLIDLAYMQLTTNKKVWPLFNTYENPELNVDNPAETCRSRLTDGSLQDEVWVIKN